MLLLSILDKRLKGRFSVTDQLIKQGAHNPGLLGVHGVETSRDNGL
jgi:hypothetical protein